MASRSSWAPDEASQTLLAERSWLQSALVSSIAYGITLTLCILSFNLPVRKKNRIEFKQRLPWLIYITISFLLGTLYTVSLSEFTQMAFIDDRNYPGGPNRFENTLFSIPIDTIGNTASVMSNWLSDALMVWRFKIIYRPLCQAPLWAIMALPCLMLAGSVGVGIVFLNQISTTSLYDTKGINFTLPYLGLSLGLNITLTIAIVIRLLIFRYHVTSLMGPKHGRHYVSVATMIIESVAIYSPIAIIFLVLFIIGSPVSEVFMRTMVQFQTIATLLIVFRVAQGKAWTEEAASHAIRDIQELSHVQFASLQGRASLALASSSPGEMVNERDDTSVL